MNLVTAKWYKAIDRSGDDTVFYNYFFKTDPDVLYFSVKMSEYVGLVSESLEDFIEELYNNYEFEEYRFNTKERRNILASAFS